MKLVPRARVPAVTETAAVSVVDGASRAGRQAFQGSGRPHTTVAPFRVRLAKRKSPWRPSRSARKKCGGWNAKGIRPPNARKSRHARPPESQVSQIAITKRPKTLRHLSPQQNYQS